MRPKSLSVLMLGLLIACKPDVPAVVPMSAHPGASSSIAPSATSSLSGGWSPTDPFDATVQEAARFAVQTFAVQNKARVLYKDVKQARQQVVAGLNFELHLQVTMDGTPRQVKAKVWRQPDGAYSLHSWNWLD
jgi:hypothetical protein